MWLSLLSVLALILCCTAILILTHSWKNIRSNVPLLRKDLQQIEHTKQQTFVQVISFSKLWFRKQFALIDKELVAMQPTLLRTGLVAIREEYACDELEKTLLWQRQVSTSARLKVMAPLQTLSQTLITIAMLIGVCALAIQVAFMDPATTSNLGLPTLLVLATALAIQGLVVKPLLERLIGNLHAEQSAQALCSEGIALIHQQKTPAQVRALMEGMLKGLEASQHTAQVLNRTRTSNATASLVQRRAS